MSKAPCASARRAPATPRTGSAGEAKVRVAGSGDTVVGDIHGRLDVDIAGSGDVNVASVSGPLDVHVAGSGDVKVAVGPCDRHDRRGGGLRRRRLPAASPTA